MRRNIKLLLILLVGIFLLTGCGVDSIKANNPLSENEIISYVQSQIYNDTNDNVIVKILSKEDLKVCTVWFDTCFKFQKVDNGYSYKLEIINKDNNDIISNGTYTDGYIKYDGKYSDGNSIIDFYFESDYKEKKGLNLVKNEFTNILDYKFDKYYLHNEGKRYYIFINSSNYNDINIVLSSFNDTVVKYKDYVYTRYSAFIYKDEDVFNNTNFKTNADGTDLFWGTSDKRLIEQYTGKEATRISSGNEFSYDLFMSNGASAAKTDREYVDYNTFDYLVFLYDVNSNSFVGSNRPKFQIFGVK